MDKVSLGTRLLQTLAQRFKSPAVAPLEKEKPISNTRAILYANVLLRKINHLNEEVRLPSNQHWTARYVEMQIYQIFHDWCEDTHSHSWAFLSDINRFFIRVQIDSLGVYTVFYSHDLLLFLKGSLDHDGKEINE